VPPPPIVHRRARIALFLVAASLAGSASAVDSPTGVVFTAGVGAGGELGLGGDQKAGVAESELSLGWEHAATGIRPELGLGIGFAPDGHFAVRPGLRWAAPELPIQLRVAMDWSNARGERRWRWLLIGAAFELRWTSAFSLYAGLDIGAPLGAKTGMPLLARGGAAFRF
jgi:hypothetical protein